MTESPTPKVPAKDGRRCAYIACVLVCWAGCVNPPAHPPQNLRELHRQLARNPQEFPARTTVLYNVDRVLSESLSPEQRVESLRVVEALDVPAAEICPALAQVLTAPASPPPVRNAVLGYLAGKRYEGLAKYIAAALPSAKDRTMRLAILEWLEEHPAPEVIADIVKLWAAQKEPPEEEEARYRHIVRKISGKKWDQALLERLNTEAFFARGSALEVLAGRIGPRALQQRIAALKPGTEAVRAMQGFIERFGYVPRTRRELLATVVAHTRSRREMIRAAGLANQWQAKYDYQFNIRDLYLLSRLANDPLRNTKMSRTQLSLEVSRAIAARRAKGPGAAGRLRLLRGRLLGIEQQAESLTIADLWKLLLLNEMFERPSVREAFRIAAMRDRADAQTQWGGLVSYEHGRLAAKLYKPAAKRGDDRYLPSRQMLWDAFDAICFFVGHFGKPADDPSSVGPTERELALAKLRNACGLVVTSLAGGKLNVTYFTPEGILIDLGDFPPVK